MFTKSAEFYDTIYGWKDYQAESSKVHKLIQTHKKCDGNTLLDIGCGTGMHITHLYENYTTEGLDFDENILKIARERFPDLDFHHGNMIYFNLEREFDVITSLFSAIGYVKTVDALNQTATNFAKHLKPGGVAIIEPWLKPEDVKQQSIHALFVDEPELKISRINQTVVKDGLMSFTFHYLIGTPDGIDYFTELHELGLFTHEQYMRAFTNAGLDATYDKDGLMGRGLYIGVRPSA